MSTLFVWTTFLLTASVIVIAGMNLSRYSDTIAEKTRLGGFLVGSVFLALATSLPEVVTSVSSGFLGIPEIAVGNVLGSNLFNLAILSVADWFEGQGAMMTKASPAHRSTAYLSLTLTGMVGLGIVMRPDIQLLGVGVDSMLIAFTYAAGLFVISRRSRGQIPETSSDMASATPHGAKTQGNTSGSTSSGAHVSLLKVILSFLLAAAAIVVAGTVMSQTADELAAITGLGGTFVGSIFVALATSLPELVASVTAVRIGAIDLAVGNVLGSNVFNMVILIIADLSYPAGPILSSVHRVNAFTALSSTLLTMVVVLSLSRRGVWARKRYSKAGFGPVSRRRLGLDTSLILIGYLCSSYLLYSLN